MVNLNQHCLEFHIHLASVFTKDRDRVIWSLQFNPNVFISSRLRAPTKFHAAGGLEQVQDSTHLALRVGGCANACCQDSNGVNGLCSLVPF